MRLTFIHDHKFIYHKGEYYSSGKFSEEVLSRYFIGPIDKIQFIGRIQESSDEIHNLVKASNSNILVNPMLFLKTKKDFITKKREIESFLKANINSSDIVIIRMPSEIGYVAASFLNKKNIPYGIELVGDPWDALWYYGSISGKIMAYINKYKVKKYLKKSSNNIYVTKEYLQKRYPSKNNSFVASNVLISSIKNNYKENNELKRIGMIGSLDTKYKGIETALKSLSKINNDFIFEIVGNGPKEFWENKIEEYKLSNKVILKGTLQSGLEVNKWLSTLDLYIQPSYTEGLPRALIEAMSNGIPALGSSAGGIPELLNEKYIHKIKDYKELSRQIDLVLSNPELRKEMSEENLIKSKDYLSENIQQERIKFIKSVYREHEDYET